MQMALNVRPVIVKLSRAGELPDTHTLREIIRSECKNVECPVVVETGPNYTPVSYCKEKCDFNVCGGQLIRLAQPVEQPYPDQRPQPQD
jgi:hypothetical protein